ncbi:MAG: DUF1343 domain-containing protein [Desulfotalea sp.]
MIKIGLEHFLEEYNPGSGERFAFLSNQACTDRDFKHGKDLVQNKLGNKLTCLFSPQHGYFSEKQDNMIESDHVVDPKTGLEVYSLYGAHRKPTAKMMAGFDTMLIDLIDIGTRVYTFMYTMAYCLQAAVESGKKVIILDRPNPLGGLQIEGNLLEDEYRSFVGLYNLPMRHGLTLGELALFFNKEYSINANLEIIKVSGWQRDMYFDDGDYPWVSPSPNMPTVEATVNYPGQVIWEGTMVSEGRGTTLPFSLFGTPYWQHEEILSYIDPRCLEGCILRSVIFEPTFGKWMGESCKGFQLHVTDRKKHNSYRTALALLQAAMLVYPDDFEYKQPPYEYEYDKMPIDMILGSRSLREKLAEGQSVIDLEESWRDELDQYDKLRSKYFLY